jgi:hypothetical protein
MCVRPLFMDCDWHACALLLPATGSMPPGHLPLRSNGLAPLWNSNLLLWLPSWCKEASGTPLSVPSSSAYCPCPSPCFCTWWTRDRCLILQCYSVVYFRCMADGSIRSPKRQLVIEGRRETTSGVGTREQLEDVLRRTWRARMIASCRVAKGTPCCKPWK